MKKTSTLFLIIIFSFLFLSSCNNKPNNELKPSENTSVTIETTNITVVDPTSIALSDFEKQIYSILVDNISYFNNPSSVKLIAYDQSFFEEKILLLRISGTNKFGAIVTNDYIMAIENFQVTDAYAYLDYYEKGHMPAIEPTMRIENGVFYSFETWGNPYVYTHEERNNIPSEYFVLYQIANYAIPDTNKTDISIANINKALDNFKITMGW